MRIGRLCISWLPKHLPEPPPVRFDLFAKHWEKTFPPAENPHFANVAPRYRPRFK